jgi:peptide/nickel transport system substrate-binding protein
MYANPKTDSLLSQARSTVDTTVRNNLYKQLETTIENDTPAVFLYAPDFLYIVPDDLSGVRLGSLSIGAERFLNVYQWYMDTENVWTIFAPNGAAQHSY